MYENSKALPSRQSASHFLRTEGAQSFHEVERLAIRLSSWFSREKAARRAVMEQFGSAIAGLLECNSCYIATVSGAGAELEEARIGCATIDPSCTTAVARIARKGADADCAFLEPVNARTALVRKLIGSETGAGSHSVIGRFAFDGVTVVFVAGWRSAALLPAEIPCLARAVRMMWETACARTSPPHRYTDLQTWLEGLIFPAIVVNEDLRVHELNRSGRTLLAQGKLLTLDRGMLAGLNSSVTESLKEALRETLMSHGGQGWLNTTVTLSTDRQKFAFARFGAVPAHYDAGKVLVIVPQFDEVSGAKRIASAFSLNWAEERIIARILQGQCPRLIGADLGLTEATVRTYTKRIMLKLGINRQSEFFLLYHLTWSPFGASRLEKAVGRGVHGTRTGERTH